MATKRSYKKADLDKYIEANEIELIGEYEKVNYKTKIKGKCKTEGCDGEFEKGFSYLLEKGKPICLNCANVYKKHKTKNTKKNLGKITNVEKIFKIIKENEIELIGEYDINILDDKSMIIGKCKTEDCINIFQKTIHFVEDPFPDTSQAPHDHLLIIYELPPLPPTSTIR